MKDNRSEIFEIFIVLMRRYPGVPTHKLTEDAWTIWAGFDYTLSECNGTSKLKRRENSASEGGPLDSEVEVKP